MDLALVLLLTTFQLYYIYSDRIEEIGTVKIGQIGLESGSPAISTMEVREDLPEDHFSLGQSDFYYENLKNLGADIREAL